MQLKSTWPSSSMRMLGPRKQIFSLYHSSGWIVPGFDRTTVPPIPPPSQDRTFYAFFIIYNLLTDRYIYDLPKKLHAKIMKILLEAPVPIRDRRPDLPEGLAAIIHRALARDPQARYPNVREMRRALLRFAT